MIANVNAWTQPAWLMSCPQLPVRSGKSRDIWSGELPTHSSRSHRRLHSKHLSMELGLVGRSPCLVSRRHSKHSSKTSEPHDTHYGPSREHRITEGTEQSPGAESPSGRRHIAPTGRRWSSVSRFIVGASEVVMIAGFARIRDGI